MVAMTRNFLRQNYQNDLLLMAAETAETGKTAGAVAPDDEGMLGRSLADGARGSINVEAAKEANKAGKKAAKSKGSLSEMDWLVL